MKKEEIGAAAARSQCLSAPRPAEDIAQKKNDQLREKLGKSGRDSSSPDRHHITKLNVQNNRLRQRGTAPGQVNHTTTMSDDDLMCLSFCVSAEIVL